MIKVSIIFVVSCVVLIPSGICSQGGKITLPQCIELALKNNPQLSTAQSDLSIARQEVRKSTAQRLPSLAMSSSYRHQSVVPEIDMSENISLPIPLTIQPVQIGVYDQYEAKVTVSQPLFAGFRLRNSVRATHARSNAISAEYNRKKTEVIYRVKAAYLNVLGAKKLLSIAETSLKQVAIHETEVRRFVDQGMARKNELLQAQVKLSEAELKIVKAQNGIKLSRATLENVVGISLSDFSDFQDLNASEFKSVDIAESVIKAIHQRVEMQVIQQNQKAAEWALEMARGEKYPSIAAFGVYAYGRPGLDFVKDEWMDYWIVGVGAEWNVWDWGAKSAKNEQAQLQVKRFDDLSRQMVKTIELEVTQACLKIEEAVERARVARRLLTQAEENFRVTENAYKNGQVSNTEFLDAQTDLTRAQIGMAQVEIDYQMAKAFWEKAVGDLL